MNTSILFLILCIGYLMSCVTSQRTYYDSGLPPAPGRWNAFVNGMNGRRRNAVRSAINGGARNGRLQQAQETEPPEQGLDQSPDGPDTISPDTGAPETDAPAPDVGPGPGPDVSGGTKNGNGGPARNDNGHAGTKNGKGMNGHGNGKKNGGMNGYGNGKKNGNGGSMSAYGNGKRNGGMNGYGNGKPNGGGMNGYGNGKKNGNGGGMNAYGNGKGMNGGGTGGIGIGKVNGNGGTKNGRDMPLQRPDAPQVDDTHEGDDGDEGTTMPELPAPGPVDEEAHGGPGDGEQIMQNMYDKPKNGNGRPSNGMRPTNGVHEDDRDDIQQMMQHMMNGGRRNGNGNGNGKKPRNGYQPRNGGGSDHGGGNDYGGGDHGEGGDHGDGHDGHHGGDPIQWLRDAIRGEPGQDYPIFAEVPSTAFKCSEHEWPGYYADVEARCQVFHICQMDGRADAFLCPNGTIFSQQHFVCVWWHDFDCSTAESLYQLNSNLFQTVTNQSQDNSEGDDNDDRTGQVESFK